MRIAEDVRAVWARSWVTPWVWPLIVGYNFAFGVVLLIGGIERINGPSFAVIRQVGSETTGLLFIVVALAMWGGAVVGRAPLRAAMLAAAVLHVLLAAGFLGALLSEPPPDPGEVRPALTGVPTYLFVAAVHFANAFIYGRRGPLGERGGRA